jgi:hypothetical protein
MVNVNRELRDWLRSLAGPEASGDKSAQLSLEAADYLERIATDGTLKAALSEIAEGEPELAG